MTQSERIFRMEKILDEASSVIRNLSDAAEQYAALLPQINELEAYYTGPLWKKDFADDEAGKLPSDLKRGMLSEDAIYNLLQENTALKDMLKNLSDDKNDL